MAYSKPFYLKKGQEYLDNFREHGDEIPSIAGLSRATGRSVATLYRWRAEDEGFEELCQAILTEQERTLINNGLNGTFNSNICKLVLGKHGYHDRSEHTGANGEPLIPKMSDEDLARRAAFFLTKVNKEMDDAAD